jgi:septal ring factor EnvC (AmiA/AmiB activator)
MVRKILAGVLIGLGGLLFVSSLVVVVASWVYNEPLTQNITGRLAEIDGELASAQTALRDARAELERTLRLVEAAEETLSALKEELAQSKTFVGDVDEVLETQLIPGLKARADRWPRPGARWKKCARRSRTLMRSRSLSSTCPATRCWRA